MRAELLDEVLLAVDAVDVGLRAGVDPLAVDLVLEVPGADVGERRGPVEVVAARDPESVSSPESWSRAGYGK